MTGGARHWLDRQQRRRDYHLPFTASAAADYTKCTANAALETGLYTTTFPYLNQISQAQSGSISNYNALQVTATLRATHGLSFLLGYTWAHALDDGTIVYPSQLSQNYGNGVADVRNRFTISPTYVIPGIKSPGQMLEGWSVTGLVLLQGGLPWTATDSSTGAANDILGNAGATGTPAYDTWNYSGPPSAFKASRRPYPLLRRYLGGEAVGLHILCQHAGLHTGRMREPPPWLPTPLAARTPNSPPLHSRTLAATCRTVAL